MSNTRLTVVVRKDLQMPVGLLAAQVAHMADAFMRSRILDAYEILESDNRPEGVVNFTNPEVDWCREPYISVLAVNSYEDLCEILEHVNRENLPVFRWDDLVPSPTFEGKAIKAFIGLSIGPADFDKIKIVTSGLELY